MAVWVGGLDGEFDVAIPNIRVHSFPRGLPLLLGLIAGWSLPSHRTWLLTPVICMAIGLVKTLVDI
ncbi:MAG TPA: hypothetical protein VGH07_00855, partial [Chthoniobacterales bacterium]